MYRPPWRRLCAPHGRWLLDVGEGHPLQLADVASFVEEVGQAQRRWVGVMLKQVINAGTARPGDRAKRVTADRGAGFEAIFLDPVGQTSRSGGRT
ncbi:hypothetical protein ACIRPU_42360 [Streptomyces sp. NPDC102259]|uniref:hypothetical protein n=1 Tax=Streptomyces sp. NPDC102259 TaxID=3366148 RepID=UPI0037F8DFAE